MPLLIRPRPEPAPAPPRPTPPGINRPDYASRVVWTSARGRTTELTAWDAGYVLMPGVRGLDMPPYQLYRQEGGVLDGDVVTGVRAQPREIWLPVRVYGRTRAEARARRRQLASDLDPHPANLGGPGRLTVYEYDGTHRWITAYYAGGMEGSEGQDEAGLCWATYGITFTCPDPYWSGPEQTIRWQLAAAEPELWLPILPLQVVSGQVIGEGTQITVAGTAAAWPVWTITGPAAAGLTLRNTTSGQELVFDAALTGSDRLVIDTRPRRKSVLLSDVNAYGDLALGSALWPLLPGLNIVDVVVEDADAGTEVAMTYTPSYITA